VELFKAVCGGGDTGDESMVTRGHEFAIGYGKKNSSEGLGVDLEGRRKKKNNRMKIRDE